MDTTLPDGTALPYGWALQDPADYMDVMLTIVPELLRRSGIDKENIIGIGTDFTASTVMPVDAEGMPLCLKNEFRHNPHAYVKHWKHHGAQAQANRMTETAAAMNEKWIDDYGGKISCENAFTKLLEVYENDRKVYAEMAAWVEAADWIVWQLTGRNTLSTCCAGYKFFYSPERGFPCAEYLEALSPGFGSAAKDKLLGEIVPVGSCAGRLKKEMAEKLGLLPGIAVAAGTVDAHAGVPAAGSAVRTGETVREIYPIAVFANGLFRKALYGGCLGWYALWALWCFGENCGAPDPDPDDQCQKEYGYDCLINVY